MNTAPSNAAMDVCSSPSVGSNDARPPAAEFQAAAFSEGGVGVEGGALKRGDKVGLRQRHGGGW